jgi:hypothetical protein
VLPQWLQGRPWRNNWQLSDLFEKRIAEAFDETAGGGDGWVSPTDEWRVSLCAGFSGRSDGFLQGRFISFS